MKSKLIVLSAALMLVLAGCGNKQGEFIPASSGDSEQTTSSSTDTTVHVESVSVSPASLTLVVGQESTLTATVLPENATNKAVTWTSSSASVTVDDGLVRAVSEGGATITATTADGAKTATCQITVNVKPPKPAGAVDLEYGYAEVMDEHGNDYCYFDNHEHWGDASYATVNEAYIYDGTIVYDYTVGSDVLPSASEWGIQLIRENTELVTDKYYDLSFSLKSSKAGTIIVNDQERTIVVGDNNISVTYKETELQHQSSDKTSFRIQFPHVRLGSARVEISEVDWVASLMPPEGVVVAEPTPGNFVIQFADAAGANGYKAYYVNSSTGEDVDSEEVTNGGALTKVASLPDGKYKVFVTSLQGTKESARSSTFGTLTKGEVGPVVPAGGPKTPMENGQEHTWPEGILDLPDDRFVYWADQNWNGSLVTVDAEETYTEEGTVHAKYAITSGSCDWAFQIFYKNTSLTAGKQYTLSYKVTSLKAGTVGLNTGTVELEAGVEKAISIDYTENANDASFKIVFPSSMGDNTVVLSNFSWVEK